MLRSPLAAWRRLAKELGLGPALLYAANRVLVKLSGGRVRIVPYALYAQPIGAQAFKDVRDDPATCVTRTPPGDPLVAKFPRPASVIQNRYAQSAQCYSAVVKGEFGGFIWIARDRYEEDEVRCTYVLARPDSCVWDFDVYLEPRYRMGRTMGRLWKAVDADLAAIGVRWSYSRISIFNPGSLGSHERLGAKRVGLAIFLVIGPLQTAVMSLKPYIFLSWPKCARPTIVLKHPISPSRFQAF